MSPIKQQSIPSSDARPYVMQLRVLLPARVLVDETVVRIVAEAENGAFGVLPRHIDFLAALQPGVLVFEDFNARVDHLRAVPEDPAANFGGSIQG